MLPCVARCTQFMLTLTQGGRTWQQTLQHPTVAPPGQPHHVAAVVDGTSMTLYVNKVAVTAAADTCTRTSNHTTGICTIVPLPSGDFCLGANPRVAGRELSCAILAASLWLNRALLPHQFLSMHPATISGTTGATTTAATAGAAAGAAGTATGNAAAAAQPT
jgi:Concanavalin A-like lectin/glucanases superfamily